MHDREDEVAAGHTEHRHFEQRVGQRAADHRIVGILEPVQPQLRVARELACRPAQDRAGDRPVGRESREQIEQDARVCGRGKGRDHRTGERVPQLGRRRTNTDGEREMVDVVEIAGHDRGNQRGDQLVERTCIEHGPSVDRFARGLVLRGELRRPRARAAAR